MLLYGISACQFHCEIALAKAQRRKGFSLRGKSEPTIHVLLHLLAPKSTFVKETGAWVFRQLTEIEGRARENESFVRFWCFSAMVAMYQFNNDHCPFLSTSSLALALASIGTFLAI